MIKTTMNGRTRYLLSKIKAKSANAIRLRSTNRRLMVLGGYHGENTGDWAMGQAIKSAARAQNIDAQLIAMRDIGRIETIAKHVIIGGGAVATPEALNPIADIWAEIPFRVTLVGVDFSASMNEFSPNVQRMCQAATSIGLRHEAQFMRVRNWSKNEQTYVHSDVAFALRMPNIERERSRTLAMNLLPLFHVHSSGRFKPGSALSAMYQRNNSKFFGRIEDIAGAYVRFVKNIEMDYSNRGYSVIHVPFAPEDDAFARAILPKRTRFSPFSLDLCKIERKIAAAELFVPTRFHALVAGIRTKTPMLPIAYAGKAESLLTDFGVNRAELIDRETLFEGIQSYSRFLPSDEAVFSSIESATRAIKRAVAEVMGSRS